MTPPARAAAQTAARASQATRGGRAGGSEACSSPFIARTRRMRLLVRYDPRAGLREPPTQFCCDGLGRPVWRHLRAPHGPRAARFASWGEHLRSRRRLLRTVVSDPRPVDYAVEFFAVPRRRSPA